jgi:type II secretory pathway pseudopilin PulG
MTLVELLISLSITSMLLAGLCAAFNASMSSAQLANSYINCTQNARQAMSRVIDDIRQADAVRVDDSGSSIEIIRPPGKAEAGEISRQYFYDHNEQRISMKIIHADGGSSPIYEVARDISACAFGPAEIRRESDQSLTTVCVPVSITCTAGGSRVVLNATASPRRAAYNRGQ